MLGVVEKWERNACRRMIKGTAVRNEITDIMRWGWNSFIRALLQVIGRTLGFKVSKMDNHWRIRLLLITVLSSFLWLLCGE